MTCRPHMPAEHDIAHPNSGAIQMLHFSFQCIRHMQLEQRIGGRPQYLRRDRLLRPSRMELYKAIYLNRTQRWSAEAQPSAASPVLLGQSLSDLDSPATFIRISSSATTLSSHAELLSRLQSTVPRSQVARPRRTWPQVRVL